MEHLEEQKSTQLGSASSLQNVYSDEVLSLLAFISELEEHIQHLVDKMDA